MPNKMTDITLNLSLEDINKILGHLGKAPYQEVYEVIAKISQQAQEFLKPKAAEWQKAPSARAEGAFFIQKVLNSLNAFTRNFLGRRCFR